MSFAMYAPPTLAVLSSRPNEVTPATRQRPGAVANTWHEVMTVKQRTFRREPSSLYADPATRRVTPEERIGERIAKQPDGCWVYQGDVASESYPGVNVNGDRVRVHRYVYQLLVGPIPDALVLHHECGNRHCCNPAHLVPMTNGDHISHHAALRRKG